ncbi:MAG: hypothetical protein F4X57_13770 [Chloroflexi bacterium]|nr:hypothetical protein [Chloroflexota bacterium]
MAEWSLTAVALGLIFLLGIGVVFAFVDTFSSGISSGLSATLLGTIVPLLVGALFGALAASHKGRRVWLWAILCGILPISLFFLAFNKCYRCDASDGNNFAAHWLIGLSAPALFIGFLVWQFDVDDPEREQYRLTEEAEPSPSDRYHAEKVAMLEMINEQRRLAAVSPLRLGHNEAAQLHAEAMRDDCFVSHWDTDGLKPYMRYSLEGGYQYNAENVGGFYDCGPFDPYEDVEATLEAYVLGFMDSEGHRETMLDPLYRKVSIGIATNRGIWVVQHFEGEYIEFDELPSLDGGILSMSGHVKEGAQMDEDVGVMIEYDPPVRELTIEQLEQTQCYNPGLPVAIVLKNPFDEYDLDDPDVRVEIYEMLASLEDSPIPHEECRDPYKMDLADSYSRSDGSESRFGLGQPDEISEREVYVSFMLAEEWSITNFGEFSMRADIGNVMADYGSGVYTVTIVATIAGELSPISVYAVFVDW